MSLISGLLGVGASLFGNKAKKQAAQAVRMQGAANQQAAQGMFDDIGASLARSQAAEQQYRNAAVGAIQSVANVRKLSDLQFLASRAPESFLGTATNLTQSAWETMSAQQRSNLEFSIGGANENLRQAQIDFSALAAGDTSAFNEIVQASAFGALAENAGMPMGAFANTSARNMLALRQSGVEGSMGITDFFAKQGTVDPINPIDSVFRLADFERLERTREQELDEFNRTTEMNRRQFNANLALSKATAIAGVEQNIFSVMSGVERDALQRRSAARMLHASTAGADQLASSMSSGGFGQALQQISNLIPTSSGSGSIFRNPLTGISYGDFRGVA